MPHQRNHEPKSHGWRKLLPLATGLLVAQSSGFCADHTNDFAWLLDGEIAAYKKRDYSMALTCGTYALRVKPNDALARYFLASSLAKLNRKKEAIQQFGQAAAFTSEPRLLSYIKLGLDDLVSPKPPVKAKPVTTASTTAAALPEKPTVVTKELSEAQQQALNEAKNEIDLRRKEADRAIAKIHDEEAAQLSGVEQYQFKETDTNGKADKVYEQTPAYTALFEKLKKDNEPRISEINAHFTTEKERIEAASKLRVDAYASSATGEKTQLKMGNGLTQVMPIGSNMYVRNIINYGADNRTPELKGKMQSLEDKTPPSPLTGSKAATSK